jgi:hypothetical protein
LAGVSAANVVSVASASVLRMFFMVFVFPVEVV